MRPVGYLPKYAFLFINVIMWLLNRCRFDEVEQFSEFGSQGRPRRLTNEIKTVVFNNAYGFPQRQTVRTLRDGGKPVGKVSGLFLWQNNHGVSARQRPGIEDLVGTDFLLTPSPF